LQRREVVVAESGPQPLVVRLCGGGQAEEECLALLGHGDLVDAAVGRIAAACDQAVGDPEVPTRQEPAGSGGAV
jgi:hypothetical protein